MTEFPGCGWCVLNLKPGEPAAAFEHLRILQGLLEGVLKPDDPSQREREEQAFRRHTGRSSDPSCPA